MKTRKMNSSLMILMMSFALSLTGYAQTVNVTGTKEKWHKIAVSLTLPGNLSESSATFKNNRMDVIFTSPSGRKIRVPGFFAADGNAANSNAKAGKIYKAYLRPDETGAWTYRVLYYTATDVALKEVKNLPSPLYNLTGSVGSIVSSSKSVPDLRAKGRLKYQTTGTFNQRRYLKFAETGEYFLKIGPDSPENLLHYNDFDFDDRKNKCGLCVEHFYRPHARNYRAGDPTWDGGKGKNLIGALNYIQSQRMNSFSMSLYGGDDKNVFPWTKVNNKFVYDVSKLEQWEIAFDHAETLGLMMHFKLAENENWDKLNRQTINVYYREMVARFGHHLAIEWNISEEYRGSASSALPRINWLAAIDPWSTHRVIHTYPGEHNKYDDWLAADAKLTGASIQSPRTSNYKDVYKGKGGILTWINKSKSNNTPWVVSSDEQNSGKTGIFVSEDMDNHNVIKEARTRVLWKTMIAGGSGVMWYGGGRGDFRTENFNRFGTLFKWSEYAVDFFKKNNIPFWKMVNDDRLVSGSANCLAEVGKFYTIYLENGGSTNVNLSGQSGNFDVLWFDPRNGGSLKTGNVTSVRGGGNRSIGNPPNNKNSDWVVLIKAGSGSGGSTPNTVMLSPIQDAYTEGIAGKNNALIRLEGNRRAGYLMFDLSGVQGTITKAELKLSVSSDAGNGTIKVEKGDNSNWTETTLSASNKPSATAELGSLNGTFSLNTDYTWSLDSDAITAGENLSLILTQTTGNDVAFASKESGAPQLVLTLQPSPSASTEEVLLSQSRENSDVVSPKDEVVVFPNPVVGSTLNINLNLSKKQPLGVKVFDNTGRVIYNKEYTSLADGKQQLSIDMKDGATLQSGIYFLRIDSNEITETIKLIVK